MRDTKKTAGWQSFLIGLGKLEVLDELDRLDMLDKLETLDRLGIWRLILVFLCSLVLLDEFVLYITWNELVALEAHGEGSATTGE